MNAGEAEAVDVGNRVLDRGKAIAAKNSSICGKTRSCGCAMSTAATGRA